MRKVPKPLPIQIISNIFKFSPETGQIFWNEVESETKHWNRQNAGKPAGTINADGYVRIAYREYRWMAHRIAYALHYGVDDPMMEVDHINGVRHDNRPENLRLVSQKDNCANNGGWSGKELPVGVVRAGRKFQASISRNGEAHYLGKFKTPEEASAVYQAKRRELDGELYVDREEPCFVEPPEPIRGKYGPRSSDVLQDDVSAMFS